VLNRLNSSKYKHWGGAPAQIHVLTGSAMTADILYQYQTVADLTWTIHAILSGIS